MLIEIVFFLGSLVRSGGVGMLGIVGFRNEGIIGCVGLDRKFIRKVICGFLGMVF